jgi:hypothetical protein
MGANPAELQSTGDRKLGASLQVREAPSGMWGLGPRFSFAEASLRTPETAPAIHPIHLTPRCYENADQEIGAPESIISRSHNPVNPV